MGIYLKLLNLEEIKIPHKYETIKVYGHCVYLEAYKKTVSFCLIACISDKIFERIISCLSCPNYFISDEFQAPIRMTLDGTSIRGSMRSTRSNFRDSLRLPDTLPNRTNSLRGKGGNGLPNQSYYGNGLPNNGNSHLNKVAPVSKSVDPNDTVSSQPVQLQLASTASI